MKYKNDNLMVEVIAFVVFFIAYLPTLLWMWERWFARDSYYSHGILVPLVSLFLIWQSRYEFAKIKQEESPWGLWLIVIGIMIFLGSSVMRVYFTSGFSMIIVLYGLILFFHGNEITKKVAFAVFFLVFMVPLPMVLVANISFKLKLFAAELAAIILNGLRLPAIREGSIIKMQSTYVVVDDVCSGLRSLISLNALGYLFAFYLKSSVFKKILLFLSTFPIAIITNVVRVVFLSFVSEVWGAKIATGFIHDFSGFMVFAIAFILLYIVSNILE